MQQLFTTELLSETQVHLQYKQKVKELKWSKWSSLQLRKCSIFSRQYQQLLKCAR